MYKDAAASYGQLLSRFPRSAKGAAARLRKGLAHFELGDKTQGVVELQYCMYEYPTSEEARMAKEKLTALGISAR
jgi:TolA-binding protein